MNIRLLVAVLCVCFLPAQGQRPKPVVTTIETDKPLVSNGKLGGVSVDAEGTVFIANFGANVWAVAPDGSVKELASDFWAASGNTLSPDGTLLQADIGRKAIYSINLEDGTVEPIVTGGLLGPVGLVTDPEWNLYVCDCAANTIVKITPVGETRAIASGDLFACPNSIARDAEGNLYVVNFKNDLLVKIDSKEKATVLATVGESGGNSHLALAGDHVYVAEINTNKIYSVGTVGEDAGVVRHVVGSGADEIVDGAGTDAGLKRPNGLAADPSGRWLYTNNVVGTWQGGEPTRLALRRIDLQGGDMPGGKD